MKGNREAHRVTAEGWDVVAEAKYEAEFDEHLGLLRRGGHTLLEPELDLMGTLLPGSHVVHLQCSHGLDALGLLNLGAHSVLGVDISRQMIRQAAAKAEAFRPGRAEFIHADVLELPPELAATADLVYTGRGSLPWVLDIRRWADAVARVLRPGAHAFIFEGHPLDALWEREASTLQLRRGVGYFDDEPREAPGFPASVVERVRGPDRPVMLERQWRPSEVIEALLAAGLELRRFQEHPVLFWDQLPRWPDGLKRRLPHSYAVLVARPDPGRRP